MEYIKLISSLKGIYWILNKKGSILNFVKNGSSRLKTNRVRQRTYGD